MKGTESGKPTLEKVGRPRKTYERLVIPLIISRSFVFCNKQNEET
jgi:hypothetical protein